MQGNWGFLVPLIGDLSLKAAVWGMVFGAAGCLMAFLSCWLVFRKAWLRRVPKVWNVLAKLSYFLIWAAFVLAGIIGGALYGAQRVVDHSVAQYLEPALTRQMPDLRKVLARHLEPMTRQSMLTVREMLRPMLSDLYYKPRSSSWVEQHKARLINDFILHGGAVALTQAFQQSMRLLPEFLPEGASREQNQLVHFSVNTALKVLAATGEKVDFSPLDQNVPKVFSSAVQRQIDGLFKGIYVGLLIKLVLVMVLVGLEMLFYFLYWRPRWNRRQMALAG